MRISKMLSAVCAVVICAGVTAGRAQDTPAQAAALAALKQKMSELAAQAGQPAKQSPPPIVVTPSGATVQQPSPPPAARQPALAPVAVAAPAPAPVPASDNSDSFAPVPPPSNPQIQAGAQAVLQEKINGSNAEPTPPQTKSPAATVGAPKETKADAQKVAAAEQEQKRAAQAAVEAKANKEAKKKPSDKSTAKEAQPAKPVATVYPGKALGFNPIEAPPPPVSAEQEAALRALLARYMANEVTPDQYQAERKKILAGP